MTTTVIDETEEAMLLRSIQSEFPIGSQTVGVNGDRARENMTRAFITEVIDAIDDVTNKRGIRVVPELETFDDHQKGHIRGIIIWYRGNARTVCISVSPDLCRIRNRAVYLGQPEGAENLLEAILNEVESEVESVGAVTDRNEQH